VPSAITHTQAKPHTHLYTHTHTHTHTHTATATHSPHGVVVQRTVALSLCRQCQRLEAGQHRLLLGLHTVHGTRSARPTLVNKADPTRGTLKSLTARSGEFGILADDATRSKWALYNCAAREWYFSSIFDIWPRQPFFAKKFFAASLPPATIRCSWPSLQLSNSHDLSTHGSTGTTCKQSDHRYIQSRGGASSPKRATKLPTA